MLNQAVRKNNRYYSYVDGMLNVVYLTGWVREPNDKGFLLQQTNNMKHAIPVSLGNKSKIKSLKEFQKIKIIGHLRGVRDETGLRSITIEPFHSEAPTILEMPLADVYFTQTAHADTDADKFMPFDKNFKKELEKAEFIIENFENEKEYQEIVNSDIRSEYTLNNNCNQAQVAGYLSGFKLRKGSENEADCLLLSIRQNKDDNLSIPVRLYGMRVLTYAKELRIGMRVQVSGSLTKQYKQVKDKQGNVIETLEYVYVKCSDVISATIGESITKEPVWLRDMLNDIRKGIEERKRQLAEFQAKNAAKETAKAPAELEMAIE